MGPDVRFAEATLEHARELALTMREGCRAEVHASSGVDDPYRVILRALRWTRARGGVAAVALVDGEVLAMFGCARRALLSSTWIPWSLSSELVDRHPRLFWRASRGVLGELVAELPAGHVLEQFVDARYDQAVRWVGRLGFTVEPARPFGALRLPFHRITLRRSPCANP